MKHTFTHKTMMAMASLVLTLGMSAQAQAVQVFENPWNMGASDGGSFSQASQMLAGQFSLASATTVNRATWYGTMNSTDPLNTGDMWNFDVVFRMDVAGAPGAIISTAAVVAAVTDTGVDLLGQRSYLFDAMFPGVALLGTTDYFLVRLIQEPRVLFGGQVGRIRPFLPTPVIMGAQPGH